ncbi:MAG: glycosyltransferase family 4 protein [Planctomycetes bacterium]|nr:glycosyltransferase family 4 protein [Planctomycetota bacterium]
MQMRILIVIDNFHPLIGGAEQAALESGAALVRRGHRVDVLTMRKRPEWSAEEEFRGLRIVRFDERIPPKPFGRLLYERANAAAARRTLDRQLWAGPPRPAPPGASPNHAGQGRLARPAYDLILLHPIAAAAGALQSRAAARAVVVYCFHAPLGQEHLLSAQAALADDAPARPPSLWVRFAAWRRAARQRAAVERADVVTCPSQYSRDLLAETVPRLGGKPVAVIPWGVDADRFCPAADRAVVRASLGWAPDEVILLTVRRLVPRMGLGQLIRAFGLASAREPRLRLVVGGEGLLRAHLEELARTAGGRVDFAGLVPPADLPRHLQAADLFLLPSLSLEAFGLVTLEALACGTPVLATRRCASPEILGPLDERLLIASTDAPAIAEAILGPGLLVAAEPGFRDRCRAYAVENYSWDRTAAAFEGLAARGPAS